jgi:hypothetical protein
MRRSRRWTAWAVLVLLWVAMVDVWNWGTVGSLLFGWMPVGLWWPALVTLLAVPFQAYAFSVIWPQVDVEPQHSRDGEAAHA